MIVGVSGGMGAGKSFVAALLGKLLGVDVVNADMLCRELLQRHMPGWKGIGENWGTRFFDPDGNLDRSHFRQILFADADLRHRVEEILHPLVHEEIINRAAGKKLDMTGLVVEVPLLFEVGWEEDFDWIVVVYAEQRCCIQRIVRRDRVSEEEGWNAIATQISLEEKALRADSVVDNSGALLRTILQVYHLANLLRG